MAIHPQAQELFQMIGNAAASGALCGIHVKDKATGEEHVAIAIASTDSENPESYGIMPVGILLGPEVMMENYEAPEGTERSQTEGEVQVAENGAETFDLTRMLAIITDSVAYHIAEHDYIVEHKAEPERKDIEISESLAQHARDIVANVIGKIQAQHEEATPQAALAFFRSCIEKTIESGLNVDEGRSILVLGPEAIAREAGRCIAGRAHGGWPTMSNAWEGLDRFDFDPMPYEAEEEEAVDG